MPLVSVVMPVFDRIFCVADSIDSVLAQTHRDLECIVVDDGSTDGTPAMVHERYASEERVRVLAEAHAGAAAARNHGLRDARGEYVTFLDSDDVMPPTRIARQLELLTELSCDAVLGAMESVVMPGVTPPAWMETPPEWGDGYHWITLLVSPDRLRDIGGFDETLELGEDLDVLVRLRLAGARIGAVDEIFAIRRFFGDNLTYALRAGTFTMRDAIRRSLAQRRGSA